MDSTEEKKKKKRAEMRARLAERRKKRMGEKVASGEDEGVKKGAGVGQISEAPRKKRRVAAQSNANERDEADSDVEPIPQPKASPSKKDRKSKRTTIEEPADNEESEEAVPQIPKRTGGKKKRAKKSKDSDTGAFTYESDEEFDDQTEDRKSKGHTKAFRLKTTSPQVLSGILNAIYGQDMVKQANICATPGALRMTTMDSRHVGLVEMRLDADFFDEYECAKPRMIGISMNTVAMLMAQGGRAMELELGKDGVTLLMRIEMDDSTYMDYAIPTQNVEDETEDVEAPKVECGHYRVYSPTGELAAHVSSFVQKLKAHRISIGIDDKRICLNMEGDEVKEANIHIPRSESIRIVPTLREERGEEISAAFSGKLLTWIVGGWKSLASVAPVTRLILPEEEDDKPHVMRVLYAVGPRSFVKFYGVRLNDI
jgi:hypothetical protein